MHSAVKYLKTYVNNANVCVLLTSDIRPDLGSMSRGEIERAEGGMETKVGRADEAAMPIERIETVVPNLQSKRTAARISHSIRDLTTERLTG